jgi:hypothetical protein
LRPAESDEQRESVRQSGLTRVRNGTIVSTDGGWGRHSLPAVVMKTTDNHVRAEPPGYRRANLVIDFAHPSICAAGLAKRR